MTTTHVLTANPQGHTTSASKVIDGQIVHPSQKSVQKESSADPVNISPESKVVNAVAELSEALNNVKKAHEAKTSSSSDASVAVARSVQDAHRGTYQVSVVQLAQSQKFESNAVTDGHADQGSGELSFRRSDAEFKVKVSGNVHDIAVQINSAEENFGVHASVVDDLSGARLVLSAKSSGAAHAFSLSAVATGTSSDATSDLKSEAMSILETRGNKNGFEQTVAAQDAKISINGRVTTHASNEVVDETSGLTLNLTAQGSTTIAVVDDEPARIRARGALLRAQSNLIESAKALENELKPGLESFLSQLKSFFAGESTSVEKLREKLDDLVKGKGAHLKHGDDQPTYRVDLTKPEDLRRNATDELRKILVDSLAEKDAKRNDKRSEHAKNERSAAHNASSAANLGTNDRAHRHGNDEAHAARSASSSATAAAPGQDRRFNQLKSIVDSIG